MKFFLFNLVSCLILLTQLTVVNATVNSSHIQSGEIPQDLTASEWDNIQAQIAAKQYMGYSQLDGSVKTSNISHKWRIHFQKNGTTTLRPKNSDDYSITMKLTALGYGQIKPIKQQPKAIINKDNKVTYQWTQELKEVWTNSEHSLEQWFILDKRPVGYTQKQKLNIQLALNTDLTIKQKSDGIHLSNTQGTDISYSKLKVWDKNGTTMPSQMLLTDNTINLQIDDANARYPLTIDPLFQQQAYLKASNAETDDRFGYSVAAYGDTLVVSARNEEGNSSSTVGMTNNLSTHAGAVYVFIRSGTTWNQQAYLKASNAGGGDVFGSSVAIFGDTLVVGAPGEDGDSSSTVSSPNNSASDAGAAYVFTRSGSTWSQQAYLKASNAGVGDSFGTSVAISGDTVVVGSYREDGDSNSTVGTPNNSADAAGAAYVFTRSGSTWSQQAYLKASNTETNDWFGYSVGVSGDTVIVGAHREDGDSSSTVSSPNNSASDAGAVYVFTRSGSTWSQQAYLKANNAESYDNFGYSVDVSADTIVVGANGEDGDNSSTAGSPNNSASDAGAAYIFTRSGSTWSQQSYLKSTNTDTIDTFGGSVVISGNTVVVGAIREDGDSNSTVGTPNNSTSNAGAAYIFNRYGNTWVQQTYLKASNTDVNDGFGYSVAISDDTVLVGAVFEDGNSSSTVGSPNNSASSAGAAYVFNIVNTEPVANAVTITGTGAVGTLLTSNYTYSDVDNDAEGTSTFRWLRGGVAIVGAAGSTYTVVAADSTQPITFEVTPIAVTGANPGLAATSSGVIGDDKPVVTPPADIITEATAATTPVNLGTASVTDDITAGLTANASPLGPFSLGLHTITWTSQADAVGNIGTATQLVNVQAVISGNVNGLTGSLTLQNNAADDLVLASNGGFRFTSALDNLSPYAITVLNQPTSQYCTVINANGQVNGNNVSDILVECTDLTLSLNTASLDFGGVFIGTNKTQTITLNNTSTGAITLSQITNPSSPFSITSSTCSPLPFTLNPGDTCQFVVSFEPISIGGFTSSIDIISNAVSSPNQITLSSIAAAQIIPTLNLYGLVLLIISVLFLSLKMNLSHYQRR